MYWNKLISGSKIKILVPTNCSLHFYDYEYVFLLAIRGLVSELLSDLG